MDYLEMTNRWLDLLGIARVSTLVSATNEAAVAKWMVNEAVQDVATVFPWSWLEKEWQVTTIASYSTGTVTVTNNSTAVTGSGTTWISNHVGGHIRVADGDHYYRISAVGSATTITLDTAYVGTTASGATYEIYKDEYDLGTDVWSVVSARYMDTPIQVVNEDAYHFDWLHPDPNAKANPTTMVMFGTTSPSTWRVKFYPIPTSAAQIYVKGYQLLSDMSANTDTAAPMPVRLQQAAVYKAFLDALESGMGDNVALAARIKSKYESEIGIAIRREQERLKKIHRLRSVGDAVGLSWRSPVNYGYPIET